MFSDTMIKLGGIILLFVGICLLALGFIIANKSMEATGFIGGIIAAVLLYYAWSMNLEKEGMEEPEETIPIKK